MIKPKIYFYTIEEGDANKARFQDLLVNLAEGFQQLGIEYYASNNYWQTSPDSHHFLIQSTPEVSHQDCDIVVLERHWYEKYGCLPNSLFASNRQYKTVYFDCKDGIETPIWGREFRNFDFIFKTHYCKHTQYPANCHPWAFGLSQRVLNELKYEVPWQEKKAHLLVNFRNKKIVHSLRAYVEKYFIPQIKRVIAIETASEDLTAFPQDPYHYLRWRQTGKRHYPDYYRRLEQARACACFGGFFLGPWYLDRHSQIAYYLFQTISKLGLKNDRIGQWDSWRLWESMAAGCVTFHVDFRKYGFELPVMPENWRHYIGIDLDNISDSAEKIIAHPELLEQISKEGKKWAIKNYKPSATAKRFLKTVFKYDYSS